MIYLFAVLFFLSFPITLFGIVNLIYPFWIIKKRRIGLYIFLGGFFLSIFGFLGIGATASSVIDHNAVAEKSKEQKPKKVLEVDLRLSAPKEVALKKKDFELKIDAKNANVLKINDEDYSSELEAGAATIDLPLKEKGKNTFSVYVARKDGEKISSEKEEDFLVYHRDPEIHLTLDNDMVSTTKNSVRVKGTTEPGATVTLLDGKTVVSSVTANKNGDFTLNAPSSKSKDYGVESRKAGFTKNDTEVSIKRKLSKAEKIQAYKRSCKTIAYSKLEKNPDKYAGDKIKLRGKIMQIEEDGNEGFMLLEVTPMGYGFWKDNVYIEYKGTNDFVKDNVVTVYGEVYGDFSYTSQAGWEISVPAVIAKYIEK